MINPLVSIITNSYNSEKFLKQNIISVLNQEYQNWEHIVIDCGSTDNSIKLLNNLCSL